MGMVQGKIYFPGETKDETEKGRPFQAFCSSRDKSQGKLGPVLVLLEKTGLCEQSRREKCLSKGKEIAQRNELNQLSGVQQTGAEPPSKSCQHFAWACLYSFSQESSNGQREHATDFLGPSLI